MILSSGKVSISAKEGISKREVEVLKLIADEYTTKEIASELYISFQTVLTHRKNLLEKMDVKNTAGLIRKAFECGIMELITADQLVTDFQSGALRLYRA